ncbi:MAG TPA: hypothetical protein VNT52_09200, partial [Acidimicrobiales bacterium]|nr:hypothetical protein [Acidimicrobiales bacterium]
RKGGNGNAATPPEAPPVTEVSDAEAPAPEDHTPSTAVVDTRKPPKPPGPPVDTTPFISYPPTGDTFDGPLPANFPRSYGNATPYDVGASYEPPSGTEDFQLPERHIPAEPPPSPEPAAGPPGLVQRVLMFTGEQTPEERDRIAAAEFEAAIAPVMEYMRQHVPEASTPEEAARIWSENQGEITPDPNGGSYVHGDAFDADARVYYRLLRRDYEKNPRPSDRKSVSHHLHGVYGKLTGTKGW